VSTRTDGLYRSGKRHWIKVKTAAWRAANKDRASCSGRSGLELASSRTEGPDQSGADRGWFPQAHSGEGTARAVPMPYLAGAFDGSDNDAKSLAPRVGFEPTTSRLTAVFSAVASWRRSTQASA
jgi:hypothetical protein